MKIFIKQFNLSCYTGELDLAPTNLEMLHAINKQNDSTQKFLIEIDDGKFKLKNKQQKHDPLFLKNRQIASGFAVQAFSLPNDRLERFHEFEAALKRLGVQRTRPISLEAFLKPPQQEG